MRPQRLVAEALVVGGAALVAALWVLRAWELDLAAPLLYEWDALLHLAYIENLRDGGWFLWNDRLAAPFGQDVRDFPLGGENLHWLSFKLLGAALPSAAATASAYLLLTYVLVAVATYVVARLLRLGRGPAVVVAMLFAFLPFHQLRWTMHLLRSGYYPVPLAALAILWVLDWRHELRDQPSGAGPGRWRALRVGVVIATGALLGSSDTQNALYAALVLLPVALLVTVRDWNARPLALALAFSLAAGAALVSNNLPYLLARAERGPNPEAFSRTPSEQETYGLRLARLVMPVEHHRIASLADASAAAVRWGPATPGEAGQALGAVGTLGLFIGLAAIGLGALGRPLLPQAPISLAQLGLVMVTGVLWATVGGFSYLLSIAGLTAYRTWNRMSLWIALFALLAIGSALRCLLNRVRRRWVRAAVVSTIIVVGLLDQVPTQIRSFDPARLSHQWRADAAFFQQVEEALPAAAMVYQLPAMEFPEPRGVLGLGPHEQLKPYLHTAALRFSHGGMKGRPEGTWSEILEPLGPAATVGLVALAGFDGLLIDRRGYADAGVAVEAAMARVGATRTVVDAAGERALWSLQPVRDRLGRAAGPDPDVRQALFNPLPIRFDDGFFWEERDPTGHRWRWASDSTAGIRIGGSDGTRRVVVSATLGHLDPTATAVTVTAGETAWTVPLVSGHGAFTALIDVPASGLTLDLTSDGQPRHPPGDPRRLAILVRDLVVADQVLIERLCTSQVRVPVSCDLSALPPAAKPQARQ